MRGLLLCCLVALATCESIRYDLGLNHQKTYEYKYEGAVNIGRGMPNLAESGVRLMCKVKVIGVSSSAQTFMLQVSDVAFEEFNGFPKKNAFEASPKLTKRLAAQLVKPFVFQYANGHVDNIRAPADVSDTIVNIVRGILGFFQVTVKTTQRVYELEEISIHGICQSNYIVEDDMATKDMTITQVVDVSNCDKKAAIYRGMANAVVDKISSERGESVISTVRYIYTVKPTAEGGLITKANALEQQHFTPFNVKGGTFKMQATKSMVLLGVTDTVGKPNVGTALENKGNLVYKFIINDANIPIVMQNLADPALKAVEMIKHLAEANIYQVDSATTENIIKVYQLLRVVPSEGLEAMWRQLAGHDEHRRWFLDMIVEVNDARILKFLELRFKAGDLTPTEAGQTLLLSFNHLQAEADLVEMAKDIMAMPFSKSHQYLWHTVVLSYGSLVNKLCAYSAPCPSAPVQPLLDMAMDGLKNRSEEHMVLALKAIGNAGHPGSIKTIMRFLPGVAATPVELPPRVLSAAVQAMRLVAARDPHNVQDITLSLFVQSKLPAEIRMLAFMILFETKPPLALVSTVTAFLQEEKNHHVASFAYSLMRGFARSSTPDNHFLSTACNVAVKILAHKFGRLSYRYSKAVRLDWFNDNFLVGTVTEIFMLRSATSVLPTEIMMKGKFHFIGRILQFLEFGIRAEGIKELFDALMPGSQGELSFSDFKALLHVLQEWEKFPEDKHLLSTFVRASGQEMFFADLNKEAINNVIKAVSPSAAKGSPLWGMIEDLQRGISWHKTMALLIMETRYIQATTLGFPLEISKYLESVNAITVKAKTTINPPLTENLGQLMASEIYLETDGFIGSTHDMWVFHGINTEFFQCGTELKSKLPVAVPWKFATKINLKENKFELDFPPCKKEIELFSLSSNVFAVSRNIEDAAMAKMTPMVYNAIDTEAVEVTQAAPAVVTSESETIVTSLPWHPHTKMCAESNLYGAGFCVESELKRDFHEEYPLHYFLGYTHAAFKLVPAHAIKPVDKIHIEANTGPNDTHPANTLSRHQLLETLKRLSQEAARKLSVSSSNLTSSRGSNHSQHNIKEGTQSTPEAVFNIKVLALSGNAKPDGYHTVVYYTPKALVDNVQLITSQVADEANWKMCTDATVDTCRDKVTAHMTWGAECQTYGMSMKAARAAHLPGSKPTLQATVQWARIPEAMVAMGRRIERYIPGMAYFLGFYQQHGTNARQEVSAQVVASSADSIDVKIKLPEYTLERQAVPMPLAVANFQDVQLYPTNTTYGSRCP